jgi:hypothetical protein
LGKQKVSKKLSSLGIFNMNKSELIKQAVAKIDIGKIALLLQEHSRY